MTLSEQKEHEKLCISEFLIESGYEILNIDMEENPDAFVTAVKDGTTTLIGIEHTDYYSDAAPGETSRLGDEVKTWDYIFPHLERELEGREDLRDVTATYSFRKQLPTPPNTRPEKIDLLKRLVDEMLKNAEQEGLDTSFKRVLSFSDEYCLLGRYFRTIIYRTSTFPTSFFMKWQLSPFYSYAPINGEHVVRSIEHKTTQDFDWKECQSRWLCISCSRRRGSIAPPQALCEAELDTKQIETACDQSPFDNIFFYERARPWIKRLK